ncbi:hypothetical protein HDV03_002825, partial [Kappamyces sp. JEL0829]
TGDVFAALVLAHLETLPIEKASLKAVETMVQILRNTNRIRGGTGGELALIQSAPTILNPPSTLSVKEFATY